MILWESSSLPCFCSSVTIVTAADKNVIERGDGMDIDAVLKTEDGDALKELKQFLFKENLRLKQEQQELRRQRKS